jgi:hypothetical protein
MDDHQKEVLELLLPDTEEAGETTDEAGGPDTWLPACSKEDIVSPDHDAKAPFTLLEKDGRPRIARIFQLKARGRTETSTSIARMPSTTRQPRTKQKTARASTGAAATLQPEEEQTINSAEVSASQAPQNVNDQWSASTPRSVWKTCERCGIMVDDDHLGRHLKSCHGKCENCRNQGIPCKKACGKWTSCEGCKGNGLICRNFSHSHLAEEAKRICEHATPHSNPTQV